MKWAILALGAPVIVLVVFFLSAQMTFGDELTQETVVGHTDIISSENPIIPFISRHGLGHGLGHSLGHSLGYSLGHSLGYSRSESTVSEIANFSYELPEGEEITSASIGFRWGGRDTYAISRLGLYLDDRLVINFSNYFHDRSRSRAEKRTLNRTLSHGGVIDFSLQLNEADFAALYDGEASLKLVGKPKFFRSLRMPEVTLRIIGDYFYYNLIPKAKLYFGGDYSEKNVITITKFVPTPDPDPSTDPFTNHDPSTIPEPSTMLLIGSGLLGAGLYRRFRKPRG